jgi:hypothetical protein
MNPIKDTSDIRARMMRIWNLVEKKEITATEARLHISLARTILETLKVEIAAAHLSRSRIPAVPISGEIEVLPHN